jgi:hypothetical protein
LVFAAVVATIFGLVPWAVLVASGAVSLATSDPWSAWHTLTCVAGAACLAQLSVMLRFYALSQSGWLYGMSYPLGACFGVGALLNAMRRIGGRETVVWRGTTYRGDQVAS